MSMELIRKHRFIGILRHIPAELTLETAKAMYEGGIRIFEITFDPSHPENADATGHVISQLRNTFGSDVSIGCGTAVDVSYAKIAANSGAEFIVSPCTDSEVISFTKAQGLVSIPGAYTPTEIQQAYHLGADIVKIFPILPDGLPYLKNVISPLSHIPFMVTGGINPNTIRSFLDTGAVAVAAGATIATRELAINHHFDTIRTNAQKHTEQII